HLHVRAARGCGRSASRQARRERCRDRGLADGEPVPLHWLLRDHARDRESARRAMRPFDYIEPERLDEALEILAADPDDTLVMAGGTSLVILMKQDLVRPERVLGLRRIAELRAIGATDGGLALGALATHGALATYKNFLPATLDDYATVSVAAVIATNASGVCTHARIALGGAATVPLRARDAERSLAGRRLDDAAIREAAALAAAATDPIDDLRGSADYKRAMAGVWTERALREVA